MMAHGLHPPLAKRREGTGMGDVERIESGADEKHDLVAQHVAGGAQFARKAEAVAQQACDREVAAVGIFGDAHRDESELRDHVFQPGELFACMQYEAEAGVALAQRRPRGKQPRF